MSDQEDRRDWRSKMHREHLEQRIEAKIKRILDRTRYHCDTCVCYWCFELNDLDRDAW